MVDYSNGVPYPLNNLQPGNRYIKEGYTLYPSPSPVDIYSLPSSQEVIGVLSKQLGRLVLEYDTSWVVKSGFVVKPAEAEAMELVSKHSCEVFLKHFNPRSGQIHMSLIP
jgi:hypothetical protein